MKIADFFVQITAKGDLKALELALEYEKRLQAQAKVAIANAKVKVAELKKETVELQKQNKEQAKQPKTLKEMLVSAIGLNKAFVGIAGSILLGVVALDKMVTKLNQANQLYTNFQRQTGLPTGRALAVSGALANLDVTMSPEEVMQNMQNLQSNLVSVRFGMGNIAPYQMAGINPWGTNSADMIEVLRKQLKQFAPEYRTFLLQQMGLDPRLGALIDLSDTEYLKYKQEALELYLSPSDRKTIQELAPEWNKINLKFSKSWEKLILLLSQDTVGLMKILSDLFALFVDILSFLNTFIRPFVDLLTMILRPLYLILDDIVGFLIGKDSMLGRILRGDNISWKTLLDALLGKDSKEEKRANKSAEDLAKTLINSPIGQAITGSTVGLSNSILSIIKGGLNAGNNLRYGDTTNNKNVSMKNDFNINVSDITKGFSLINPLQNAMNSAIAQLGQ